VADFNKFDADGNGSIDRQELRTLLNATAVKHHFISATLIDRLVELEMTSKDKDNSGGLDFNEYMDMVFRLKTGHL